MREWEDVYQWGDMSVCTRATGGSDADIQVVFANVWSSAALRAPLWATDGRYIYMYIRPGLHGRRSRITKHVARLCKKTFATFVIRSLLLSREK